MPRGFWSNVKSQAESLAFMRIWTSQKLKGFGNGASTNAAGTDLHGTDGAVADGLDFLQVRVPDLAGFVMGMADIITGHGLFAADFADSRHLQKPPRELERQYLTQLKCRCNRFLGM